MSDAKRREYVLPALNDPQLGSLETPINASGLTRYFIDNLPIYRGGLTPLQRGLEVGMAHGYFLVGPFAKLGPLRDAQFANLAGLISALALLVVATLALSLYGSVTYAPSAKPVATTAPPCLANADGWQKFTAAFLVGSGGGAVFAYLLLAILGMVGHAAAHFN